MIPVSLPLAFVTRKPNGRVDRMALVVGWSEQGYPWVWSEFQQKAIPFPSFRTEEEIPEEDGRSNDWKLILLTEQRLG